MIKKINLIFVAFISLLMTNLVASADTKLSIGSCPIGCTAYTWSAGIADVINNNVEGVSLTAEETKGYVANIKLLQNNELEISMATTLSSYQAYAAEGPYKGTEKGKILPSRVTQVSTKKQKELSQAVKRARFLALLPYVSNLCKVLIEQT